MYVFSKFHKKLVQNPIPFSAVNDKELFITYTEITGILQVLLKDIWPASREKGPSDITNCVDQDQPLHDIENIYT